MSRRLSESLPSFLSVFIALSIFLCFAEPADGQGNPGTPSFSAYDSHEADTINLQNLNIMLNVPVYSKSGAFPLSFTLQANSYVYQKTFLDETTSWEPGLSTPLRGSQSGLLGFSLVFSSSTKTTNVLCPDGVTRTTTYTNWIVTFADGTKHPLPVADETDGANCFNPSGTFTDQTIDGSGYTVTVTGTSITSVYDSSGKSLTTSAITDSNNNAISLAMTPGVSGVFTDTLGVNPAMTYGIQSGTGNNQNGTYWWTDINRGSSQVTETNTAVELKSNFGCSYVADYDLTSKNLTTSISFPDSTTFGIQYEGTPGGTSGQYTGRLSQLTLRRGGTISYQYPGGGIDCNWMVPPTLKRVTSDGTTTYTWAAVFNGGGNTTTVVDNGGNKTVYTFTGLGAVLPATQVLTQVQKYQNTGTVSSPVYTLLTTDVYCYQGSSGQPGNCATAAVSLPVTEVDVYHTINGMSNSSRTKTTFDKYGNVLVSAQYDFGATSPTVQTTTTYGTWNGSVCVSVSSTVNNKPCDVLAVSGGNTVAESRFAYDSHGNLLTTYRWTGSSWLSNGTANTYNSNGTVVTSRDLANNPTSYAYNGTGGCNNLFPTSITAGGLTTYKTWNCTGGVPLTSSNPNSSTLVTTYGYQNSSGTPEPFWRLSSVTDPLANKKWTTYATTSINSSLSFGSSINNATVTTDGYSRGVNHQTQQAPSSSTYDTTSSTDGWSNTYRSHFTSLPCATTLAASCSGPGVTTLSDVLGRPYTTTDGGGGIVTKTYSQNDVVTALSPAPTGENNKQVQREYDGLGRTVKLCQILSSGGTACGQNTGTSSGNLTSYAFSTFAGGTQTQVTRGSQIRTKKFDALGRLTYDSEPESGTKTYSYDTGSSSPSCAASVGDLGYSADANLNNVCHTYDTLHRVTSTLTNASGTPDLYYVYDSATVNSVTMSNTAGKLAEQYTVAHGAGSAGTKITDEGFSYDIDGRMTDFYQKTLNSGGWFHTTTSYFANGAPSTVGGIPGFTTETYGLDGEGRLYSAMEGSTPVVSSATFNAASQPLTIAIGAANKDSDIYTYYDSTTGRMKTYTYTVGSTPASMVGTLTWNTNGTLRELSITDGFNSGGTQDCKFGTSTTAGYDDLGRIVDDDCSPVWAQTFSYDQYNNITKSGSITWAPGYNSANNQYQLGGTSYDNNGNLTNDSFSTYAWNAYNQVASIGTSVCGTSGTCMTYDASGRMVEKSVGSVFTEYLFSPIGKIASVKNGTTQYAMLPLPGGASLYKTTDTTRYFQHKDWLGNARLGSSVLNRTVYFDRAFAPYGESYQNFGATSQLNFTGDMQDMLAGLYDTPNRELNPSQGRWLSPDPAEAAWNLYAYPANPNSSVDPSGLNGIGFGNNPHRLLPPWQYLANMNMSLNVVGLWGVGDVGTVGADGLIATVTTTTTVSYQGDVIGGETKDGTQWAYASGPIYPIMLPDGTIGITGSTALSQRDPRINATAQQTFRLTGQMVSGTIPWLETAFLAETMLLPGVGEIGTASQLADYDTYVIGRMPDTATWQGVPFTNVLNAAEYDAGVQAGWEASAVKGGQPITLASPINETTLLNPGNPDGFSVFGSEASNFLRSGYTWGGGNLLTPP